MQFLRIALIVLIGQAAGAPQRPTASIEGTVVKMGSGEPLAGARVALDSASTGPGEGGPIPCPIAMGQGPQLPERCGPNTATTGADGKFVFPAVMSGTYRIIATRNGGFVPAEYGQRSPTGEGIPLEIAAGQRMTGIQLAMSPTGSIAGRIFDGDGEPLGKAQVQALRLVYRDGQRRMTIVQSVETNDRGEYRLFWLAPGRNYVSAKPDLPAIPGLQGGPNALGASAVHVTEPARFGTYEQASKPVIRKRTLKTGEVIEETHVPVYYPGVVEAQSATAITLGPGATVGGVDVSAGIGLVATHHIRGRAIDGTTGQPMARAGILATPRTLEPLTSVPTTQTDPNGFFDLAGALPGPYVVAAQGARFDGAVTVDVGNRDVENIVVVAGSGFKVPGRFTIDGRSLSGRDSRITDLRVAQLIRDPQLPGMPPAGPRFNPPPSDDGSFTLDGVAAGDFRVTIRGVAPDDYVKSIRLGRDDVLDGGLHIRSAPENPLEIVIGSNAGRIHGTVMNSRQEPLSNRTVVLVPDLRTRHRTDLYKTISTDTAGRFQFRGVPPGDYKLFAWEDVERGAWLDPGFLQQL